VIGALEINLTNQFVYNNETIVTLLQIPGVFMSTSNKINSIARAAEVLKCLSAGVTQLTEISRRLDVNKASVYRIMKTLQDKGMVSQDPSTRKYYLGPLIQTLAENPTAVHQIVVQLSISEMERLRNLCGETVVIQIRRGAERLILENVGSNHAIQYFPEKRYTAPIHAGAGAKILLAGMDLVQLSALLNRLELIKVGPNTITDKGELIEELERVRLQGHAVSFGEAVEGAASIAVPILNYSFPIALIILGPEDRIKENCTAILKELKVSAAVISKNIFEVTGIQSSQ